MKLVAVDSELVEAIFQTGIGSHGLDGDKTALSVHIESTLTHITCNPAAVNLSPPRRDWRTERRRTGRWKSDFDHG
ncbi:MAG: hypothetical protein EXS35_18030 [Pedosphaera sp.]|nr:hypothetical protein [Pedosphaera sp.]